MDPARRALAHPALAVAALALVAGCSATNPYTTTEDYQPADTESLVVGPVRVASLGVFTEAEGEPGALVLRVVNTSTESQTLSLTAGAPSPVDETLTVPAGTTLAVGPDEDTSVTIAAVGQRPGEVIPMTLTAADGTTKDVTVPVLNGDFPMYATLVPTPSPTGTPTAAPTPDGPSPSSGGRATPTGAVPSATDEVTSSAPATASPRTLSPSGGPTG